MLNEINFSERFNQPCFSLSITGSKLMANLDRGTGFCSDSSENGDEFQRDSLRSPTDTSEDSVEVKLTPIVIPKNKRKCLEPSKIVPENGFPLKKRIKFEDTMRMIKAECTDPLDKNHFRPWDTSISEMEPSRINVIDPAKIYARHPGVTTLHRVPNTSISQNHDEQEQPLALLSKSKKPTEEKFQESSATNLVYSTYNINNLQTHSETSQDASTSSQMNSQSMRPSQQRNYKNMTRERRIEANARERTRVHTISAAFDTLRKSIPSYSNTQKLSKLSVLRVACSYILTLSRIVGDDYSPDHSEPSIGDCVEEVTKTIQTEGKIRKKKDE